MSFQTDITDDEGWKKEILGTTNTVQVVELYQSWCGSSKAIVNTFKKAYYEIGDRPLKFYTANCSGVKALAKFQGHCQPQFQFYKDGHVLETIVGLQGPELLKAIEKHGSAAVKA